MKRILILFGILLFSGCRYDNEEELIPKVEECKNENVTYTSHISGIMTTNCTACHSQYYQNGGVLLDNYKNVKAFADNGYLLGTIRHDYGYSPMPKNGEKISDCDIKAIEQWISNGAPEK